MNSGITLIAEQSHMKTFLTVISMLLAGSSVFAADAAKPRIKLAADKFPTGHETPEGVACDLARAFINRDTKLFTNSCIRIYLGGEGAKDYRAFLSRTVENIQREAAKKEPSPGGPNSIGKTFAARHLSMTGPASTGYPMFDFQDVMFVDVGVFLHNGKQSLIRTLVIKDHDGKWYAHPSPKVGSGLLAVGLNEESPSKADFSEAYDVPK